MKVWVDIAVSPQVLFWRPIISELQKRGYELFITTRHSTETVALADQYKLPHTTIGTHGGRSLVGKALGIAVRTLELINFTKQQKIFLAVSSSSYSQVVAATWMRIPAVIFQDYEGHPGLHIACRMAKRIFVPSVFSKANLHKFGASDTKIDSYNGLKENIYLADFKPDEMFLERMGIPTEKIIVTMRPPNLAATYHRFKNPLFNELLIYILNHSDSFVVLLPRDRKQRAEYKMMGLPNVLIPPHVIDVPNMIFHSDLVAGAGGTMNREATVLGTPVYTVFKGKMGSVDQYLIRSGKMVRIEDSSEFIKVKIYKKRRHSSNPWEVGKGLVHEVVDRILEVNNSFV